MTLIEEKGKLSWDDLADAIPAELPEATTPTIDRVPSDSNICPVCEREIVRQPGERGRKRKYHSECRPSNQSGTPKAGMPRGTGGKAEREADEAVQAVRSMALKGVMLVAVADQYSAFVVMVSLPDIMENLRGVLIRYEWLRKEFLSIKGGGSIFGLFLSILFLVVPLTARFGLIPSKRITEMLMQMPYALHDLHKRMAEGEIALTDLIERQMAQRNASRAGHSSTHSETHSNDSNANTN